MKFQGKTVKYGDNVNTDEIIPARYLNTSDPQELAGHCMEDLDDKFLEKIKPGDILIAGKNFGCGSSREHAPLSIHTAGISCVVAKSFARIFYRNSFNIGLPIVECPEAAEECRTGDELEVDTESGMVKNLTQDKTYRAAPYPEFMRTLIAAGGLMNYVAEKNKTQKPANT
jgi:3-isopropylmalate/(R)-2-methylmalate dehydratase small subunit